MLVTRFTRSRWWAAAAMACACQAPAAWAAPWNSAPPAATAPAASAIPWQSDLEAAKRQAAQQGKLVLLHAWAPWCGPCRKMDGEVFSQPEVAAAIDQHYVPVKINTQDMPAIAKQYAIRNLPADLVLAPDGRVLDRREGAKTAARYMNEMGQIAQEQRQRPGGQMLAANTQAAPAWKPPVSQPPVSQANVPAPQQPAPGAAPWAQAQPPRTQPANPAATPAPSAPGLPPLGLEGYCPVQLARYMKMPETQRMWTKGDPRFGVIHRGRLYLFAGDGEKAEFLKDPDRFAPVASGDDPVLALDRGQMAAGKREFGVMYQGRFYLFNNEASLSQFAAHPERYTVEAIQARLYR